MTFTRTGAIKFLNPTLFGSPSASHLTRGQQAFLRAPSLSLQEPRPLPWFSSCPLHPSGSLPPLGEDHLSSLFRSKVLAVALIPLPLPRPIQQEVPWAPSPEKTQNPLTSHHLHPNTPVCPWIACRPPKWSPSFCPPPQNPFSTAARVTL